jgi:hypothetical protein
MEFTGGRKATFNAIAVVVVPHLKRGEMIDMAPLETDLGANVAKNLRHSISGTFNTEHAGTMERLPRATNN